MYSLYRIVFELRRVSLSIKLKNNIFDRKIIAEYFQVTSHLPLCGFVIADFVILCYNHLGGVTMDKKSLSILKLLSRKETLDYRNLRRIIDCYNRPSKDPYVTYLLDNSYIRCVNDDDIFYCKTEPENAVFEITRKGLECLEAHSQNAFRFWIPVSISITAIVVSIISLIISILTK